MKKISAFILLLIYTAFAIGGTGGFALTGADSSSVEGDEISSSLGKDLEKAVAFFKAHKVVKHSSAVVKGKNSRPGQAFLEAKSDVNFYHSFQSLQSAGNVHPHIEHTPLFLKNRVLRI